MIVFEKVSVRKRRGHSRLRRLIRGRPLAFRKACLKISGLRPSQRRKGAEPPEKREGVSGKAEPGGALPHIGRQSRKSTHEFSADGEREQCGLNGSKNRFEKDNGLCCTGRGLRLGFLQCHHSEAVR